MQNAEWISGAPLTPIHAVQDLHTQYPRMGRPGSTRSDPTAHPDARPPRNPWGVYPVSQCRAGPVCTTTQTFMQPLQLAYQMFSIGGLRLAVRARC